MTKKREEASTSSIKQTKKNSKKLWGKKEAAVSQNLCNAYLTRISCFQKVPKKVKSRRSTGAENTVNNVNHVEVIGNRKINFHSHFCREECLPKVVDLISFEESTLPSDWNGTGGAKRAATRSERYARLIGNVSIELTNLEKHHLNYLTERYENLGTFDSDGEFSSPEGHIRLTRLMFWDSDYQRGKKKLKNVIISENDKILISALYSLQSPISSIWYTPFIRLVSRYHYAEEKKHLVIKYYIYFSRLIFELISDNSIKIIMSRIEYTPYDIIRCTKQPEQRPMFVSTGQSHFQRPAYRFSLPGLLKHAENNGYEIRVAQPAGLTVQLYEFQLSTFQWMLDRENAEGGLNGYFWEQWQFDDDVGDMYYFPLGGELRLHPPPKTTGGLLCEEMGLGTIASCVANR